MSTDGDIESIFNITANGNDSVAEFNKSDENSTFFDCQPIIDKWVLERFYLVAIFGSIVSIVSVVGNLLLFILFVSKAKHRHSHVLYLTFLALFDLFISVSYVLLMSVNVLMDYLQNLFLFRAWFSYAVPMVTISHVFMTSSSFLLVAASFEQFLVTVRSNLLFDIQRLRPYLSILALILGIATKGSLFFEYEIKYIPKCADTLSEYQLGLSEFAIKYSVYWRFWFRNLVTVFLPFFLLSYFNTRTVLSLRAQHSANVKAAQEMVEASILGKKVQPTSRRKQSYALAVQVRKATRMLVLIVFTYLFANLLNVVVTAWEHLDKTSLFREFSSFYSFSVDVVSLLTVVACAIRLPIYCACKQEIRTDLTNMICPKPTSKLKRNSAFELPVAGHEMENLLERSRIETPEEPQYEKNHNNGFEEHFTLEENEKRNGQVVQIYDFT